jgi:hypothetical protein
MKGGDGEPPWGFFNGRQRRGAKPCGFRALQYGIENEGVLWRAERARIHVFLRNEPDWKTPNLRWMYQGSRELGIRRLFFQSGSFGMELGVSGRVAGLTFPPAGS